MEAKRSAEEIRALVGAAEPALLGLMDDLKQRFGARLVWLSVGGIEIGNRPTGAIPYEPVPNQAAASEEWKRIKAEQSRTSTRRSAPRARTRVVR